MDVRVRDEAPTSRMAAAVLGALVLSCWRLPFAFFWADDWGFITGLAESAPVGWWEPHSGHVFPLFRGFYLVLLTIFGASPLAFHAASLLVWWGVCFLAFETCCRFVKARRTALFLCALFAVHPVNSTAVLWSFELCITLQMLFQLLALNLVLRDPDRTRPMLLGALLVIQNFFFANGALFPLVCLSVPGGWRRGRVLLCASLMIVFIGLQLSLGHPPAGTDLVSLATAWLAYAAVSVARMCFLYERVFGALIYPAALVMAAGVACAAWRDRSRATPRFLAAWFIATSAAVVAGRGEVAAGGGRLYYTTLTALPVLLALFWALDVLVPDGPRSRLLSPGVCLAVVLLAAGVSQRATRTFTERNVLNSASLNNAIERGRRWTPFDDPVIDSGDGMRVDADEAGRAYLFWTRGRR